MKCRKARTKKRGKRRRGRSKSEASFLCGDGQSITVFMKCTFPIQVHLSNGR